MAILSQQVCTRCLLSHLAECSAVNLQAHENISVLYFFRVRSSMMFRRRSVRRRVVGMGNSHSVSRVKQGLSGTVFDSGRCALEAGSELEALNGTSLMLKVQSLLCCAVCIECTSEHMVCTSR